MTTTQQQQQTPPPDSEREKSQEGRQPPEQQWRGVFEDDPDREVSRATSIRLKEDSRKLLGELLRPYQKLIWLLVVIVIVENGARLAVPYLVHLGIADRHTLDAIFADDDEVQAHAESLLPAAGIELWLRHLAGHSWRQPDPPAYRQSVFWKCLPPLTTHAGSCSLSLAPTVQAYEVHHQLILIERRTDRVLKLDARTHLFLRLVAHEQTIAHALTAFVDALGEPVDEEIWRAALRDLSGQGWIRLFPGGEEARTEKEAKHV